LDTDPAEGWDQIEDLARAIDTDVGSLNPVPTGMVSPFAGAATPAGWLLCNGAAVSRTTYAALYAVCGDAYGAGDGSSTFNLPNLKGRTAVGVDAAQAEFDLRGETGGAKTHTHPVANPISRQGTGHWTLDPGGGAMPGARQRAASASVNVGPSGTQVGSTQTTYTYDTDAASNGMPPYVALNYIVKT